MDYACWSRADCNSIQPDGLAFSPTLCLHTLHMLSIASDRRPKQLAARASLEAQPF
ncbi:hypothetical protein CFP56_011410 [Quercus suber]|uniref:Uncharacterized protein n=1 Tax=Quercus suber TaxID=58331 RepID=A0AAW0MDM0_QUESU